MIEGEGGKIDLNAAGEPLLTGLFVSLGASADDAAALADAIADWRDADDLTRLHGAEADDYRAAGPDDGPRNGPFESVDELLGVKGMSADLLERARPALTVFSHRAQVDLSTAPRAVLRALPGMDGGKADAALAARGGAPFSGAAPAGARTGTTAALPTLAGRAFTIRARATGAGVEGSHAAVVRFIRDGTGSYWVHAWE